MYPLKSVNLLVEVLHNKVEVHVGDYMSAASLSLGYQFTLLLISLSFGLQVGQINMWSLKRFLAASLSRNAFCLITAVCGIRAPASGDKMT
jgi:hypothetical protein